MRCNVGSSPWDGGYSIATVGVAAGLAWRPPKLQRLRQHRQHWLLWCSENRSCIVSVEWRNHSWLIGWKKRTRAFLRRSWVGKEQPSFCRAIEMALTDWRSAVSQAQCRRMLTVLEDVFGERKTPTSCSVGSYTGSSCPASRSRCIHRFHRLDPKRPGTQCDAERPVRENMWDLHLRWELKRRIEVNTAISFLAMRKVALKWFNEVEDATSSSPNSPKTRTCWHKCWHSRESWCRCVLERHQMYLPHYDLPPRPMPLVWWPGHTRHHCPMASLN